MPPPSRGRAVAAEVERGVVAAADFKLGIGLGRGAPRHEDEEPRAQPGVELSVGQRPGDGGASPASATLVSSSMEPRPHDGGTRDVGPASSDAQPAGDELVAPVGDVPRPRRRTADWSSTVVARDLAEAHERFDGEFIAPAPSSLGSAGRLRTSGIAGARLCACLMSSPSVGGGGYHMDMFD